MLVIRCDESLDGRLVAPNRCAWGGDFSFLGWRLEPPWGPNGSHKARSLRAEFLHRGRTGKQRLDLGRRDQFRERHELPLDVGKEEFC